MGETGAHYAILLQINKESAELNALAPHLEVEGFMPEEYSHDISQFFLSVIFFIGMFLTTASAILSAIAGCRKRLPIEAIS